MLPESPNASSTNLQKASTGYIIKEDEVVNFSKHKGLTFVQVASRHPGYMDWAFGKFREGSANGRLERLAKYGVAGAHNASDFSLVKYRDLEISRKMNRYIGNTDGCL